MVDDGELVGADALERLTRNLTTSGVPLCVERSLHSDVLGDYLVNVHCESLAPFISAAYSAENLRDLVRCTESATRIGVVSTPLGSFIAAAETDDGRSRRTNYDAVWMRDSVWGYFGLRVDPGRAEDALSVLVTQLDYLASQRDRMQHAIADPSRVNRPGTVGESDAVHIRFDPHSAVFEDVHEDGRAQPWAHKQNDALGLLLDATCSAVLDGSLPLAVLECHDRLESLVLLIQYLRAVRFYDMEDSGSWEEIPRRNASSIGLVVSGLERAVLVAREHSRFASTLFAAVSEQAISEMIDAGYSALTRSLDAGGESPHYPSEDPRHRTADAALLNLVFPARLSRWGAAQAARVVDIVEGLVRAHGVIRYVGDDYQSANFWFHDIRTDTSPDSHLKRKAAFIPGTEAEWFFDSWLALAQLVLYESTGDPARLARAAQHTSRAIGQITPQAGSRSLAADGEVATAFSLPESYNHLRIGDEDFVLPSPISPLNWSKAMLSLLLERYARLADERGRS